MLEYAIVKGSEVCSTERVGEHFAVSAPPGCIVVWQDEVTASFVRGLEWPAHLSDAGVRWRAAAAGREMGGGFAQAAAAQASEDGWRHRSARMVCRTCMWFVVKVPSVTPAAPAPGEFAVRERLGRCRRHAPTLGGFPAVFTGDWCGDHKLDENKA